MHLVAGTRGRQAEKDGDADGGIWTAGQVVGLSEYMRSHAPSWSWGYAKLPFYVLCLISLISHVPRLTVSRPAPVLAVDDLPTCAELMRRMMYEAEGTIRDRLGGMLVSRL